MKIAYIATYPPRECGIGTFTKNLYKSTSETKENDITAGESFIVAINDNGISYQYPPEVRLVIQQKTLPDYVRAAEYINQSGARVCVVQHEFGIFGGADGIYILPLLHRLRIPVIITLHTVLKKPSYNQKAIIEKMGLMADKIVVMSKKAIDFLTTIYQIPTKKIALIEHGVPDIHFDPLEVKKELDLTGSKVLLTFGLLGPGKGIEVVLQALPKVVSEHPEVLYVVLGKTHPHVLRDSGEEYRDYLTALVGELGIENHVLFVDKFIDQQSLFKYLYACDIYISPYLNEAQITSGTISYAVGVGAAVVSTPYWHATELLDKGRGRLFGFKDPHHLATLLLGLLNAPVEFNRMKEKAKAYGENITWPKTGQKYYEISISVSENADTKRILEKKAYSSDDLPEFSIEHISRLTDRTGIIQHARFCIPNYKEGYCLDDNARALIMALMAQRISKDKKLPELVTIYLSYMLYMQNEDGNFRNFLTFNREFINEVGSEDAFGRSIWALGFLLNDPPNDALYQSASVMFQAASPHFEKLNSIRGIANTIIGISYYLRKHSEDQAMHRRFEKLAKVLVEHYRANRTDRWRWFESLLAYDNAILPLALLHAGEVLNDEKVRDVAFDTMNFLTGHTFKEGYLSIIGNEKWFCKDCERSIFAQQPVDAMTMVLMYQKAYRLTRNNDYYEKMILSFMWFLGENDLRMSLYDHQTKGCCDGFESYGINRNQGAESSISYLISHLVILETAKESIS